jgi:hypothetical protein
VAQASPTVALLMFLTERVFSLHVPTVFFLPSFHSHLAPPTTTPPPPSPPPTGKPRCPQRPKKELPPQASNPDCDPEQSRLETYEPARVKSPKKWQDEEEWLAAQIPLY